MSGEFTTISLLYWFTWGFFMGLGWTIAAWALGKVLR